MPYTREQVVAATRTVDVTFARAVGGHEGGSVQSQHESAVEFWQAALALTGVDALNPTVKAFAQAELARHQAAIAPPEVHPWSRAHTGSEPV